MSIVRALLCFALFPWLSNAFAEETSPYRFTLQGTQGEVTDADFADKYLLITFGYTSCPDICPTILFDLKQVMKTLQHPEKLQVVFISIDPEADTPERLEQYVRFFDPRFVGLSGDYAYLQQLGKAYGAVFGYRHNGKKVEPPNLPPDRTVYHSTLLYLLSPEREMVEVFRHPVNKEAMSTVLNKYLAAAAE